jgi:hypothetical protein
MKNLDFNRLKAHKEKKMKDSTKNNHRDNDLNLWTIITIIFLLTTSNIHLIQAIRTLEDGTTALPFLPTVSISNLAHS